MNSSKIRNSYSLKSFDINFYSQYILLVAIYFYSFTEFLELPITNIAKLIIALGALYLIFKNPENIRKDPVFLIFFAIILIQVATWLSITIQYPQYAYKVPKIDRLGKLFLFIPIAWWLKDHKKHILGVLISASAGFLISLFTRSDFFSQIQMGFNGLRIDFGIRNAQHSSMVFGTIFIFCFFVFLYLRRKKFVLLYSSLLFVISIFGLLFTQTRQTFLGLAVAFIIFLILSLIISLKNRKAKVNIKKFLIISLSIFIITIVFAYSFGSNGKAKVITNSIKNLVVLPPEDISLSDIEKFSKFYIDRQKQDSGGIRLQLWFSALPNISKKPFLGWGSNAERFTIKKSKILPENLRTAKYIHNYFLGTILSYGLIGFSLIIGLYLWITIAIYKVRKKTEDGYIIFSFTVFFISYWLVINNFETFNNVRTGVFVHSLVIGCIYSHYLRLKEKLK